MARGPRTRRGFAVSSPEKKRFLKLAKRHGFGRERRKTLGLRFKDVRRVLSEMRADGTIAATSGLPRKSRRRAIVEELARRLYHSGPAEFTSVRAMDDSFWSRLIAFLRAILPLLLLFI